MTIWDFSSSKKDTVSVIHTIAVRSSAEVNLQ